MKLLPRWLLPTLLVLFSTPVPASFHTYQIEQLYSNASGTVQFVVLHEVARSGGQDLWRGNTLRSTHLGATQTFTFGGNLPSAQTANTRVLVATQGFADLHLVTPNYIVPSNFLATDGGTLSYAGVDQVTYASLPADGTSARDRSGATVPNVATNFAGATASVPATRTNYQGLWWAAGGTESGWGINFAHQNDTIFATWFTYDATGKAWWLSMTALKTAEGVYSGTLFQTSGAPFSAFVPPAVGTAVGTGTLSFTSATSGTFSYVINNVTQVKSIEPQVFGPLPTCVWGAQSDLTRATNYQDLWWTAGGTESGWGVNFAHQGNTLFATWFTYDAGRSPLWLSATLLPGAPGTYSGTLIRTRGAPFNSAVFDPASTVPTPVGTMSVAFADGNTASFNYTVDLHDGVNAATQTKSITRQVFAAPGTVCQ